MPDVCSRVIAACSCAPPFQWWSLSRKADHLALLHTFVRTCFCNKNAIYICKPASAIKYASKSCSSRATYTPVEFTPMPVSPAPAAIGRSVPVFSLSCVQETRFRFEPRCELYGATPSTYNITHCAPIVEIVAALPASVVWASLHGGRHWASPQLGSHW